MRVNIDAHAKAFVRLVTETERTRALQLIEHELGRLHAQPRDASFDAVRAALQTVHDLIAGGGTVEDVRARDWGAL